ncbi:DUF4282 domain-containing protein [Actinomyces gaoshouyii]|uniref:DUF4282 domain-containing protein n=1 Tax=Actinomyces gaoshouyii TaxID=1960083 RepID=UPI0009BC8A66|nr:DUF4282 domain-containing protein [Actinomyces gaoshouyii]ARD41400.1 hypothetical protein B6G06_02615 [Actinomyces gaoshouyii]
MQNPPVPEPSNPSAPSAYDAYPSAPAAGAAAQPYGQPYAQQVPPVPAAPGYAPPAYAQQAPGYARDQSQSTGFFKALFDLSFSNYITLTLAKVIYVAVMAACVVVWLVMVFSAFSDDASTGVVVLLLGWIPAFLYVILARLGLEASVALIRAAQNTSELVAQGRRG